MTRKKRKQFSETPEKHLDKDGKFCVYEIFKRAKKTIYHIRGNQARHISSITLQGYEGLPPGLFLNRNGYGFGKKGAFLLSALKDHISSGKKLNFVIINKEIKSLRKTVITTNVTLPFRDVRNLLQRLGRINEDNNNELKEAVASFLSTKFPKKVAISTSDFDEYKSGEIAALLRRNKVAQKLDEEDLESLKNFFPKIFEASLKNRRIIRSKRDALIQKTKNTTDKIFLDQVIKEFETKLKKGTLAESIWQEFLKNKVFRFMSSYVTSIEKQNISIDVSYPDFVLVDVYGFIDIFEIKRHDTPLLAFDDSHENYYWKPDVAKAIAQIENYIDAVTHNALDFAKTIKRKKHLDVRVIRPRGYIVAGMSRQFKGEKEFEDFRKLATSLKNINFILYDELLENLKNLRSKL
ncbi:MAG: DUF4263 domain-containing protein [Candidatus Omnitrophica bacterium]|jgi:hypothetical protein|nr:DUF4263 domain-containing protein [Candidatus Omnitrophota bacterium]